MIWAETAPTANPIAIWSIMSSLAGGLLLFILVRLAVHLYRSGDVEAYVRRIADLNPRLIRLQLRVENGLSVGKKLSEISLYVRKNGKIPRLSAKANSISSKGRGKPPPCFVRPIPKTKPSWSFVSRKLSIPFTSSIPTRRRRKEKPRSISPIRASNSWRFINSRTGISRNWRG